LNRRRSVQCLRHLLEAPFDPPAECALEQIVGLFLVDLAKGRIDLSLDGPLAQDIGTEGVNRSDKRFLEMLDRVLEVGAPLRVILLLPRSLERLPETQLELARGLARERHRNDAINSRVAAASSRRAAGEEVHQPLDENRCLAGAGRRLDDEAGVQLIANPFAGRSVVEYEGHGRSRSQRSRLRADWSLLATRVSS